MTEPKITNTASNSNTQTFDNIKSSKNSPTLRFPEFTETWKQARLSQLGEFRRGNRFTISQLGGKLGVPIYQASDMNLPGNEWEMTVASNYATSQQMSRLGYEPIKKPSVIFACAGFGYLSKSKRLASNFLIDEEMIAFIPSNEIAVEYLEILFSKIDFSSLASGEHYKSFDENDLDTIRVYLPAIAEQRKIASFLDTVDAKIKLLDEANTILRNFRKGCVQQLYSQKIRFKAENGQDFPDWEEKRLNDLAVRTPYTATASPAAALESHLSYDADGLADYADLLFSAKPYIGVVSEGLDVGRLHYCPPQSSIDDQLDLLTAIGDNNMRFIYYWMSRINIEGYVDRYIIPQMQFEDYGRMKGSFPHPGEQQKIAGFISALDRKIDLASQKVELAHTFRQSLRQQLLI